MKIALAAIVTLSILPSSAWAACGLSLRANGVTFDWTMNFTYIAVQFALDKANEEACDYALGFDKGGAADYGSRNANGLKYQLYKDSGQTKILKEVPDIASADNTIQGTFAAGTNLTTTLTYYVAIPYGNATSPTITAAGAYTDNFTISVYEKSGLPTGGDVPADTETVLLTVDVASFINVSLVNTDSAFEESFITKSIDFGSLVQGKSTTFDINVRANSNYTVTCTSTNAGKMMNGASQVPYTFYLDGAAQWSTTGDSTTSLSGRAHPVRVLIGPLGSNRAGTHSDTITIEAVTP